MAFREQFSIKWLTIHGMGMLLLAAMPLSANCRPGTQLLLLKTHALLDSLTHEGFQQRLVEGLKTPMAEVGYCLDTISNWSQLEKFPDLGETRILALKSSLQPSQDSIGQRIALVATVLNARNADNAQLSEAFTRPLLVLPYNADEPASMESITVKKVTENLKDRFICHLFINSDPPSVNFHTLSGLNGVTPVQWVMPTGRLSIVVDEKGYLPFDKQIRLDVPGEHHFLIKLKKRRFYHSRFMIPLVAAVVLGGTSHLLEQHNNDRYQSLGQSDFENRPESFRKEFIKAKRWERTKFGALLSAGFFLTLSFWF
jgi:hypothetical protein